MSDQEELEQQFSEWFSKLMESQASCLCRDVLRGSKEKLKEQFFKYKPMWLTSELKSAKQYDNNLSIMHMKPRPK